MSSFRVGLTGGLASGKSTVARLLEDHGFTVVDADELVAELYHPGAAGVEAVRETLGERFIAASGAVDVDAVAGAVFGDREARRRLEAAVHPLVRARFAEMAGATDGVIVLEATLLVEAGYGPDFDLVISVEADEEKRLARAVARGASPEDAKARLAAQGDGGERRAGADRILLNDGTPEALAALVADLAADLRRQTTAATEPASRLAGAVLVTGNRNKLLEARSILGFDLGGESVDLPEIQGLDLEAVLRAKGEAAWEAIGRPLVVEDVALSLSALNGFPGPLVKWLLEAVGPGGLTRLGDKLGDSGTEAVCGLLYRDAEGTVMAFGRTPGRLVEPRGDDGFGWDPVFEPEGESLTYAQMPAELKNRVGHRGRAWRELAAKLRVR